MLALTPESLQAAYLSLGPLETRVQELDDLLAGLKRRCLATEATFLPEFIALAAELRWQLRQLAHEAGELDAVLGLGRNSAAPPPLREVREPGGLRGTTDVLTVPDLVSLLSSLQKTGTLTLQSGSAMFVVEFEQGAIVHAVTNQRQPELRLGTILVAQNKLTEEQLQASLEAIAGTSSLLGAHLVASATVSESDLRAALKVQVRRMFADLFALKDARFTFVEGSLSNVVQRVSMNTTRLLLEAARDRDERVRSTASDPAATTGTASAPPPASSPLPTAEPGPLDSILGDPR